MPRTSTWAAVAAALGSTACGPAPVAPAEGPLVVSLPSPPRHAEPPTSPSAASPCVLRSHGFAPVEDAQLRFTPEHEPFVRVGGGQIRVVLDPSAGTLSAEASHDGVTLHGAGKARDIAIHAAKPVLFGSIAIPRSEIPLRWTGRTTGSALQVVHELEAEGGERIELARAMACAEMVLMPTGYPVDPPPEGSAELEYLEADAIELFASVDGAAVARVDLPDGFADVAVLRRRGDRVRIVWDRPREQLRVWIEARHVSTALPDLIGEAFGVGGLGLAGVGTRPPGYIRCRDRVELWASVGDERRVVGRVEPGTTLEATTERDGHRGIELVTTHRDAFRPAPGATFSIPIDVLASSCDAVTP